MNPTRPEHPTEARWLQQTPGRVQIFEASTLYGIATLNAAIRQGLFDDGASGRRILLTSNNAAIAESVPDLRERGGFDELAEVFDEVHSYNDAISPMHPSHWEPTEMEAPLWERYFRLLWQLGSEPVQLVMESIQVPPSRALAAAFPQASIDIYADGLMSYGPTRVKLDAELGSRIDRVLHLDLVPGLQPLLLDEFPVSYHLIDSELFTGVLADLDKVTLRSGTALPRLGKPRGAAVEAANAASEGESDQGAPENNGSDGTSAQPTGTGSVALVLGQYLSPLNLMSIEAEEALHTAMLDAAVAAGHTQVVFKPHPTAPAALADPMIRRARELGVTLEVFTEPVLAETVFANLSISLVVGCFSTALMTARSLYGLDVVRVGTAEVLAALKPYENSNRIPLVIIDSFVDAMEAPVEDAKQAKQRKESGAEPPAPERVPATLQTVEELQQLVDTVGYLMQPEILAHRRFDAEAQLELHGGEGPYFNAVRQGALNLPGGKRTMKGLAGPVLRRTARKVYSMERNLEKRLGGSIRGVPGS